MIISERSVDSVVVLDVTGGLKLGDGVGELRGRVHGLLQEGHKRLLLNVAAVPSVDSSGLGELTQVYVAAARQGGSLKLVKAPKRLRDLLVITKLVSVFEIFDDEVAAVASFER